MLNRTGTDLPLEPLAVTCKRRLADCIGKKRIKRKRPGLWSESHGAFAEAQFQLRLRPKVRE